MDRTQDVFLGGDIVTPDTVSLLLMKAGDIERNPGPFMTRGRKSSAEESSAKSSAKRRVADGRGQDATTPRARGEMVRPPATRSRGRVGEMEEETAAGGCCQDVGHKPAASTAMRGDRDNGEVGEMEDIERQEREVEGDRTLIDVGGEGAVSCQIDTAQSLDAEAPEEEVGPNAPITGEMPTNKCKGCKKRFSKTITPLVCHECDGRFHKSCTGEPRFRADKMLRLGRRWKCKFCKHELDENVNVHSDVFKELPGNCMTCKGNIRIRTDFLSCTQCKGQLHKQKDCSNMTIQQVKNLNRATWICEGCEGVEANPRPPPKPGDNPTYRTSGKMKYCEKLKILQWNADSLSAKLPELKEYIKKEEIDIFLIQETKLIPKDKTPKIPSYTIKRQDRPQKKGRESNRGGGLITGIRKSIPFRVSRTEFAGKEDDISEWLSVEIPLKDNQKLRLTNVYIPPVRNTPEERNRNRGTQLTPEKWPAMKFDCLFGDFNAHSDIWSDVVAMGVVSENARGGEIEGWLETTGMMCLNDSSKTTRTNRSSEGSDTSPDISFVHASQLGMFTWNVGDQLGADHKPVVITYEDKYSIPEVNTKPKYKWKFKNAKWDQFTDEVERTLDESCDSSAEKMERELSSKIVKAANLHVGKKKISESNKPWMTEEIKKAITERNRLRSINRKKWIEKGSEVKEMIKEEKKKQWKEYVNQLDMHTNPKQVFQTIRSMDGKGGQQNENEALVVNGVALVEDKDKAEAFAKTYRGFSRLPSRKTDRKLKRRVRKLLKSRPARTEEEQDITMEELERVIGATGNNKSAGDDDVPYEFIKRLGPRAKKFLLKICNRIWAGEEVPRSWRTAVIKTLLKDGKDPELTASYRPISLTACLGKILEKIIADRLTYILESRGLLTDNQAGFRQGRCTTDQILKLTQDATDQMQMPRKKGKDKTKGENATVISFFDYAKAYDKVWRDGLLHKLQTLNIPWRFVKYVRSFLSSRITSVEINNVRSRKFHLKEGLPQGSAISPLLFVVFINDIDNDLSFDTLASLFADDTAIWKWGRDLEGEARVEMQKEIDKIISWAETWKMSLNTDKTKAMIISSNPADSKINLGLRAGDNDIEQVDKYRFLGGTLESSLRFIAHLKELIKKCRQRINIMKSMSGKDWGNSVESQRTLYVQYVRSCFEYASSSFRSWIGKTKMEKLETLQNEALRSIAQLARTCPVDFLRLETNIEPLANRLEKIDMVLWDKYQRLPEDDPRRIMTNRQVPPPALVTRRGWRYETEKMIKERGYDDIMRDTVTTPTKPWQTFPNLIIDYVPLEKKKAEYTPEDLRQAAIQKIESIPATFTIYTDGSTDGNQERGGAGIYVEDINHNEVLALSTPAGRFCTSYSGEAVAMLHCLDWLTEEEAKQEDNQLQILICTDSRSLTEALQANDWKDGDEWLKKVKERLAGIRSQITLLWIPSHVNIEGNERADELAGIGATMTQDGVTVTHKTMKARIKRERWEVSHERASETYQERRGPKMEVEKRWPQDVRSLYSCLRTGHAKELNHYQHFIDNADDGLCEHGCEEDDTIEHALCRCDATAEARQRVLGGEATVSMLVTHPNECRKVLSARFKGLKLATEC